MTAFTRVTDDVHDNLAGYHNELIDGLQAIPGPVGWIQNGKISVVVSSNDLVVSLLTKAGATPSTTDPISIEFPDGKHLITSAISITLADGTNWFNAGSAELATKLVGYFVYVVWDSNSSVVALTIARIPCARLVSDFSATTTNEKHCFNYANFTTTDNVTNIGYFEATNSGSASYLWTVPTFTNQNLKHEPTFETNLLNWAPQHSRTGTAYTNLPTTNNAQYMVVHNRVVFYEKHTQHATPGGTNFQRFTLPWSNALSLAFTGLGNNATAATMFTAFINSATNTCDLYKYDGTAEAIASNIYTVFFGQFYIKT